MLFYHNIDPTRTTDLRKRYELDLVRRFKEVRREIRQAVIESELTTNAPRFTFGTRAQKMESFLDWVRQLQDRKILEVRFGTPVSTAASTSWQNVYLRSAYQKGIASAASQIKKAGAKVESPWVDTAFGRPFHADRVGIIYSRAYSSLRGITTAIDNKLSRTLALAMAEGRGADEVADLIDEAIDSIGIVRARTLARTETINAHAEASLNAYEEAEIRGVKIEAEFATAQDNRVCPKCAKFEGRTIDPKDAHGIIPVHPNCRCAWIPVVSDMKGKVIR